MSFARRRLSAGVGAIVAALAAGIGGFASPVVAAPSAAGTGPVSVTPASGTPALAKTKSQQTIRQIVQCGSMMYAVGSFSEITQNGTPYSRPGLLSFSATPPYTLSGLDANVNGEVNSIAFINQNCADAYIGGSFTSVNGTPATNIAEISTTTGKVVPAFGHDANGAVDTLAGYQDELLAGGRFTRTNGFSRPYFESLSPATGRVDSFVNLHITGHVTGNPAQVYNQQISHGGTLDLVEGNFRKVGGRPRQQIFMLNLAGATARVTGWTSPEFTLHCKELEAFFVRSAAWGPGDSTVYVADTGGHHPTTPEFPLTGLCDAVAAFPATQASVSPAWIEYSGCNSYYSVAADNGAVYAAGHPRYADNPDGCKFAGPGSVPDHGLQGLHASTGKAVVNGSGAAVYSMSRANADSMLITSAGLWISSTNRFGSQWCGGKPRHAGICFLPYR